MMRIVCAGDSLTRGVSIIRGRLRIVRENYPRLLQTAFREAVAEWGDVEIINQGAFNENSDMLIARFEKDVLSLHPDVVLLEIGANDCNFRWDEVAKRPDGPHLPNVPIDRFAENIRTLVDRTESAGFISLFLTLIPLHPVRYYRHLAATFGQDIAHWIAECGGIEYWHNGYDKMLRDTLAELSAPYIDTRQTLPSKNQSDFISQFLSDDGIHLTAPGYHWLSETVFDGLQRYQSILH